METILSAIILTIPLWMIKEELKIIRERLSK